jgi:CBS domain-containing protein
MKVREIMTPLRECVGPSDTVAAAEIMLNRTQTDPLPVLDHRQPSGTVGKQEIETRMPPGKPTGMVRVQNVMTPHSVTASPDEEADVARERMRNNGLGSIPVIESGRLVGVIKQDG